MTTLVIRNCYKSKCDHIFFRSRATNFSAMIRCMLYGIVTSTLCALNRSFSATYLIRSSVVGHSRSSLVTSCVPVVNLSDVNNDGKIDIYDLLELHKLQGDHQSLLKTVLGNISTVSTSLLDLKLFRALWREMTSIMSPTAMLANVAMLVLFRPFFRRSFDLAKSKLSLTYGYEESLIGRLEQSMQLILWFPPFMLLVDALSLLVAHFTIVLRGSVQSSPVATFPIYSASYVVYSSIVAGSLITRVKDWIVFMRRTSSSDKRDVVRDRISDELTSLLVWCGVVVVCVDALSLRLGIAVGTLFTLGSAGGLSISLALRGIMENLFGGVAIKLQDKLRVGEVISIPDSEELGEVLSVGYSSTRVRLDDDSVTEIPNQTFINRQVVNWSRTPYRLFRTSCLLQGADLLRLPQFVSLLRKELSALPGVETRARDLIVSAVGFDDDRIRVEVEARLVASSEAELSDRRNAAVATIAGVLEAFSKQ